MSKDAMDKLMKETTEHKVYCKCGSSRIFVCGRGDLEKKICPNCGNYIFKNKKIEFMYRLKEKM